MATRALITGAAVLTLLMGSAVAQTYKGQSGSLQDGATYPKAAGPEHPLDKNGINPTLGESESSGSGSGGNARANGDAPPDVVIAAPVAPPPDLSLQQRSAVKAAAPTANLRVATNVDITDVSPGAPLPTKVEQFWMPVPDAFLSIVPEWRAYRAVKIRDETVIIEPTTHKVVHIIDG